MELFIFKLSERSSKNYYHRNFRFISFFFFLNPRYVHLERTDGALTTRSSSLVFLKTRMAPSRYELSNSPLCITARTYSVKRYIWYTCRRPKKAIKKHTYEHTNIHLTHTELNAACQEKSLSSQICLSLSTR